MSPRKRKRTISKSTPAGDDSRPSGTKKKTSSACSRCRSLKVKCKVLPGNTACSKCQASGFAECPPQEPPKSGTGPPGRPSGRGPSAPPDSIEPAIPESHWPTDQRAPAATAHQPQRVQSQNQPPPSRNVQSLCETTDPFKPLAPDYLATISESDELYNSPVLLQDFAVDYDSTGPDIDIYEADAPDYSSNALDSRADNFFTTLGATDEYGSEETENFDMNVSGTEDEVGFEARGMDEDESEDENNVSAPSMEELYAQRPRATVDKRTKPKAVKPAKNAIHPSNNVTRPSYDPDTCLFTIQCITHRPDSSNVPFEIKSTISLAELRHTIAEKMERFPSHVRLQYRLPDVDKAKEGFTSIQTEMELVLFKARMHLLIVRGKLSNGRMSNCTPKNPTVVFADASIENGDNPACSKMGSKAQTSGSSSKQRPTSPSSGQMTGTSHHEELIKELQERWKCELHAKGPESPVYCWVPKDSDYCYPLSSTNLTFWAIQIMDGHVTIDEKPVNLPTQTARQCTRGSSVQPVPQIPANGPGNHVSLGSGMPGLQGLGFSGGYGYPGAHSVNIIAGAQQQLPSSDTSHPGPQHMGISSGSNSQSCSTSPVSMALIPLIPNWLIHLDQHPERNQDGVVFAPFRSTFKEKGFVRLSQLASKHVSVSDLQSWLGVTTGTAVSIKDYADEDLKVVRAGKLVIA
ncbi:hypothetical protein HD554DRAFT_2169711 [Boletus coccyginus]|nr:hypothetical protein HD554DRAFT_2169711 [Boletus coccyginus]